MGPYMAEGFLRKGTRRISSWPGETTLHKKAGYIDADFLLLNTFPLQSDGGPYISVTSLRTSRTCSKLDFPEDGSQRPRSRLHGNLTLHKGPLSRLLITDANSNEKMWE